MTPILECNNPHVWLMVVQSRQFRTRNVIGNWDDYEIYHPGAIGPSNQLPRAEARRAFNRLMGAKPARIAMLRRLLAANGVELGTSDDAIQRLNDWFRANVEPDPDHPGRLLPDWYSVVNDVALFLGDVMIERCPGLRWSCRGSVPTYGQVTVRGTEIDIDAVSARHGDPEIENDAFVRWVQIAG